jgi:Fe(3+) dicitrate transport protein
MTDPLTRLLTAILHPLTDPAQRLAVPALVIGALVAVAFMLLQQPALGLRGALWQTLRPDTWAHPSSRLDLQLFLTRRLLAALSLAPAGGAALGLAITVALGLNRALGEAPLRLWDPALVASLYAATLFVAWDLSRYLLHRLMHEVGPLWAFHQVHHSAEVLTPLSFYRVHPIESALYTARGVLVTGLLAGVFSWAFGPAAQPHTLFGVNALGLALTVLFGNARHSHAWISFGPRIERWLISPAQHQLHHARHDQRCNYGTWLAVWDRLAGSLRLATTPPAAYGLPSEHQNHRSDDLLSALFGPVRALWPLLVTLALLPPPAYAQDGADEPASEPADQPAIDPVPTEDNDGAYEVIVEDEGGALRVAGSAHVIDEEHLERLEYDDIHRVLAQVPGVYLRDEDGFGLRPNIGIRGANSDRSAKVTLLEDGLLLGPAPYAAPAAYYFPLTTRMIGIEVFKGPAAIQHGPQTVGGAINLRTREIPVGTAGSLDAAYGLRGASKLHGWGGTGTERWGVLFEGVHLAHGGFKQLDGGGPTGFVKSDFMLKAQVGNDQERILRHRLELKLGFAQETSHETYLGLSEADFAATPYRRYAASALDLMRWRRTQAELRWNLRASPAVDLQLAAYHHGFSRAWTKLNRFAGGPDLHNLLLRPDDGQAAIYAAILRGEEDSSTPQQTLQIGTNDRRFHAWGVQSIVRHRLAGARFAHQLELGARLHGDQIRRLHTEDPYDMRSGQLVATGGPTLTNEDSLSSALAIALHAREDLLLGPVRLLPGVRMEAIRTERQDDRTGLTESAWQLIGLPGLGLHVQPLDWLGVFAGLHRGFSPVAPGSAAGTLPETSWNTELGARLGWRRFRGELVGFYTPYTNLTGQCTFSGGCSEAQLEQQFNAGRVDVYGVELGLGQGIPLARRWSIEADLTWTYTGSSFRTGFVSGFPQFGTVEIGDALPYVPEHQGAAQLALLHPLGTFTAALSARSALRDVAGQGPIDPLERLSPMAVLDLAADFRVWKSLRVYATVQNVTNATYPVSRRPYGLRPAMPVQAMFGVKLGGGEG